MVVSLQCRQPSLEGTGEIKLRRLVKEALRMRPSRTIVGDVSKRKALTRPVTGLAGSDPMIRSRVHSSAADPCECVQSLIVGVGQGVQVLLCGLDLGVS